MFNEIQKLDWCILAVLGAGMAVISFLSGQDTEMEELDTATRYAVMCHNPYHNETLCNESLHTHHD